MSEEVEKVEGGELPCPGASSAPPPPSSAPVSPAESGDRVSRRAKRRKANLGSGLELDGDPLARHHVHRLVDLAEAAAACNQPQSSVINHQSSVNVDWSSPIFFVTRHRSFTTCPAASRSFFSSVFSPFFDILAEERRAESEERRRRRDC